MYLLQHGYDFFKFFSMSSVIKEEKAKYYKAIKDVEDYHSDLTYFIYFSAEMTVRSINTETARNDLSVFEALGIFRKSKVSRKFLYTLRPLEQILEAIEGLKELQD